MVRFVSGYYLSSDSDGYPEVVYFDRLTFIHSGFTVSETYEDDRDRYRSPTAHREAETAKAHRG